jgi:hypothetical protein
MAPILRRLTAGHPTGVGAEPAEGAGCPKQKPRQGDGARLVGIGLAITGLADPSEMQQAHHPNAQPLRWLMVAAETTDGHRKSPATGEQG